MERAKRELEQTIMRKDTEIQQLMTSLDDEQSGMNRIQRTIKELQARVEELEEELEAERQGRTKAERSGFPVNHNSYERFISSYLQICDFKCF